MSIKAVEARLTAGIPEQQLGLHREQVRQTARAFLALREGRGERDDTALVAFLRARIVAVPQRLLQLSQRFALFQQRYEAATVWQRKQHLLDFARDLGADKKQLKGDARAVSRYLDFEALRDRYQRRRGELEQRWVWLLERLGGLLQTLLKEQAGHQDWIYSLNWTDLIEQARTYRDNPAVLTAAFAGLAHWLPALSADARASLFQGRMPTWWPGFIHDTGQPVWARCACLSVVSLVEPGHLNRALAHCFGEADAGDERFLRARALRLAARPGARPLDDGVLARAVADGSEHVRQAAVDALSCQAPDLVAQRLSLILNDPADAVRAYAVYSLVPLVRRKDLRDWALVQFEQCLVAQQEGAPAAAAVAACLPMLQLWQTVAPRHSETVAQRLKQSLLLVRDRFESAALRRQAGKMIERLWCETNDESRAMLQQLALRSHTLAAGDRMRLPRSWFCETRRPTTLRVLAVLAQDGDSYDLEEGWTGVFLRKGPRFGLRLWRVWHELNNPATDKRQGKRHTVGRLSTARDRFPGGLNAECSPTKVPGEPLLLAADGDWRPFLPLVDDVLSCLDAGLGAGEVRFHTSEGLVTLTSPNTFYQRQRAAWRINRKFAELARLRNWQAEDGFASNAYVKALRGLGFQLNIRAHDPGKPVDAKLGRFFGAAPVVGVPQLWEDFRTYAVQIYENQLSDLLVFCALIAAFFLGRHIVNFRAIRRARRRIGLSVGGWGTRGKSGTERLKAALFHGMGLRLFSKTTGCEARFIVADPFGRQWDLPLFRPHNKATIWEQGDVVRQAAAMKSDVFLWECMGLTPEYVATLQRSWMRDDLATITNTYPDHEDLQGPSGWDVARTIAMFLPNRSQVFTSEQQMAPMLATEAARLGSILSHIDQRQIDLLPEDLVARFPYAEHPNNIALVAAMAEHLGCERDWALKEMADRVVPDVGVLKQFRLADLGDCRLTFINGMSANERLGALTNWQRLGFDQLDPVKDAGVFVTLLVNNREDRVARSHVFANMIVRDMPADLIVMIGSNLRGFKGFLNNAWQDFTEGQDLWREGDPVGAARELAQRMRLPMESDDLAAKLATWLAPFDLAPDVVIHACATARALGDVRSALTGRLDEDRLAEVLTRLATDQKQLQTWRELAEALAATATADSGLQARFFAWLWQALQARFVVIEDTSVKGDMLMQRIHAATPSGVENRILGVQNIKGPGLAFIEAWQRWEVEAEMLDLLKAEDSADRARALDQLAGAPGLGYLTTTAARCALRGPAKHDDHETVRQHAQKLLGRFEQLAAVRTDAGQNEATDSALLQEVFAWVEALFEAGRSVQRKKQALRIYRDLADERMGYQRAIDELTKLNRDQENGWLWRARRRLIPFAGEAGPRLARFRRAKPTPVAEN